MSLILRGGWSGGGSGEQGKEGNVFLQLDQEPWDHPPVPAIPETRCGAPLRCWGVCGSPTSSSRGRRPLRLIREEGFFQGKSFAPPHGCDGASDVSGPFRGAVLPLRTALFPYAGQALNTGQAPGLNPWIIPLRMDPMKSRIFFSSSGLALRKACTAGSVVSRSLG